MNVEAWLTDIGLGEYAEAFRAQRIDADVLPTLTDADLTELGVSALGDRKRLLAAIERSSSGARASSASSEDSDRLSLELIRGERKQVTVLFADVTDSTALTEGLDPEDAQILVGPAIDAMKASVRQYRGTVNKIDGDGVMAIFGAPIAQEDHALRACLAALSIVEKMASLEEMAGTGVVPRVRVGLNSGEVLVKAIRNDLSLDYDAIGSTVNLASRMETLSEPNEIRLTETTLKLAGGAVLASSVGRVQVKGLAAPVQAFRLEGRTAEKDWGERTSGSSPLPFVGRDTELEILIAARDATAAGRAAVVFITGDPGVGKSRLLEEFAATVGVDGTRVIRASANPFGSDVPWSFARTLLSRELGIQEGDDRSTTVERIRVHLEDIDGGLSSRLSALLALFDLAPDDDAWANISAGQRRRAIMQSAVAVLTAASEGRPGAILLDDLQWADSESLDLLEALIDCLGSHPVLLLAAARREFRPPWAVRSEVREIRLQSLDAAATRSLVRSKLGADPGLAALEELLCERSEGVPLYIEEYMAALVGKGALAGQPGGYRLLTPLEDLELPASLQALIASRIDPLGEHEKTILQSLALDGEPLASRVLARCVHASERRFEAVLEKLKAAELIVRGELSPEPIYDLRHRLVGEVAERALVRERRRELHARLGVWSRDELVGVNSEPLRL